MWDWIQQETCVLIELYPVRTGVLLLGVVLLGVSGIGAVRAMQGRRTARDRVISCATGLLCAYIAYSALDAAFPLVRFTLYIRPTEFPAC